MKTRPGCPLQDQLYISMELKAKNSKLAETVKVRSKLFIVSLSVTYSYIFATVYTSIGGLGWLKKHQLIRY
jgi:hypothetical protein